MWLTFGPLNPLSIYRLAAFNNKKFSTSSRHFTKHFLSNPDKMCSASLSHQHLHHFSVSLYPCVHVVVDVAKSWQPYDVVGDAWRQRRGHRYWGGLFYAKTLFHPFLPFNALVVRLLKRKCGFFKYFLLVTWPFLSSECDTNSIRYTNKYFFSWPKTKLCSNMRSALYSLDARVHTLIYIFYPLSSECARSSLKSPYE